MLLFADLARVQHDTVDANTAVRILVDGSTEVALWNSGDAQGWSYRAMGMHGAVSGLAAGSHTAVLQYLTGSGTMYLMSRSDGSGSAYVRLSALAASSSEIVTSTSTPSASAQGTSTSCARSRPHCRIIRPLVPY